MSLVLRMLVTNLRLRMLMPDRAGVGPVMAGRGASLSISHRGMAMLLFGGDRAASASPLLVPRVANILIYIYIYIYIYILFFVQDHAEPLSPKSPVATAC